MTFPRNTIVSWWSLLIAPLVGVLSAELYQRLFTSRRAAHEEPSEELAVLYFDESMGWKVLVGGERCSREEANSSRKALERRGYRVRVIPHSKLSEQSP